MSEHKEEEKRINLTALSLLVWAYKRCTSSFPLLHQLSTHTKLLVHKNVFRQQCPSPALSLPKKNALIAPSGHRPGVSTVDHHFSLSLSIFPILSAAFLYRGTMNSELQQLQPFFGNARTWHDASQIHCSCSRHGPFTCIIARWPCRNTETSAQMSTDVDANRVDLSSCSLLNFEKRAALPFSYDQTISL